MTKILVVSDTHGDDFLLDTIINIEKPELILHAGDHELDKQWLDEQNILFVKGNNDCHGEEELILSINNKTIAMTHGHKQYSIFDWHKSLYKYFERYNPDIIIYGHSHKELIANYNKKTLILNPGSISYPRNKNKIGTYIIINLDKNINVDIKKIGD